MHEHQPVKDWDPTGVYFAGKSHDLHTYVLIIKGLCTCIMHVGLNCRVQHLMYKAKHFAFQVPDPIFQVKEC